MGNIDGTQRFSTCFGHYFAALCSRWERRAIPSPMSSKGHAAKLALRKGPLAFDKAVSLLWQMLPGEAKKISPGKKSTFAGEKTSAPSIRT